MAVVSDFTALIEGVSWAGDGVTGRPVFVTFSFDTSAASYLLLRHPQAFLDSFQPLTAGEQALARQALQMWADASGVTFLEAPAGQGDIRFGRYDFATTTADVQDAAAFAYLPGVLLEPTYADTTRLGGDVFLDVGPTNLYFLLHEIGHALGLKHPHDGDPTLASDLDHVSQTVMSYERTSLPTTLGPLDLAAIRHLYGGPESDGQQIAVWQWNAAAAILTQNGAAGADTILGVGGRDQVAGREGDDYVFTREGNDEVWGEDGDDRLFGGRGDDVLMGGTGDDLLDGDAGADTVDGGAGDDVVAVIIGQGDFADGGAGDDFLLVIADPLGPPINMSTDAMLAAVGTAVRFEFMSFVDTEGDDTITAGQSGVEILGYGGHDSLLGGPVSDILWGGDGRDRIHGGGGDDVLIGEEGDDYVRGEEGDDVIWGDGGFDDVHGNMGDDTVHGGAGPDWVVGGKDNDSLSGGVGDDVVYGNLGADTQTGGDGADWVRGGQENDTLDGGAGADWMSGDRGADTLAGGAGADLFNYFNGAGLDRVIDFDAAAGDRVRLEGTTAYTLRQEGLDTVIDLGAGDTMVLVGVNSATLPAGWIIFA